MSRDATMHDPVAATDAEQEALQRIDALLQERPASCASFISASGETIELPDTLYHVLRQAVQHLAQDRAVSIVPVENELTTQRAADLLNVSRPYLIQLLERGDIPYHRVGTHRRIGFSDLMTYKHRRDQERRAGLRKLTRMSQRMGLYDTRKSS